MKHWVKSAALCAIVLTGSAMLRAASIPEGYKLLYEQDFDKPEAIKDFVFTDPAA